MKESRSRKKMNRGDAISRYSEKISTKGEWSVSETDKNRADGWDQG